MKVTAKTTRLLPLVLVACAAHAVICSSSSLYGNETDRRSLLEFRDAISLDPQQVFKSWNDSIHFCNWEGVLCTKGVPHRVTSLIITSRGLVGHISPSLGNLSFLQSLALTANTLSGEIPPSLGHLRHLQALYLNNNTLQGRIPSFANNSNLQVLHVAFNNLVDKFPFDLPPRLQVLRVSSNNLSGTIPTSLANITTLKEISFRYNHIRGNIPMEFAYLSSLQSLYAGVNQLEGRFPEAISNISTLTGLSLASNGLSGQLPPNIYTSLPKLQNLKLGRNFFLGNIPSSFPNASNLNIVDLSGNNFTGFVPRMIGKLTKLLSLNLEFNQLQAHTQEDWVFLDSLGNCSELQMLSLNSNHMSGHIPSSLGNLSNELQRLYLARNQFSGGFPSGIKNLHNLYALTLEGNHFTGVIPKWVGSLKNLQQIGFNRNFFTGTIPSSLSNLSSLGELYLDSNKFFGQIPPSFGNFPTLQNLDIFYNNLHGQVPVEIFRIPTITEFDVSFNNLDGQLPTNIGNAKQLLYLELSSNKFSGDIPSTIGDCDSLEYISLDKNNFSGSIPTSLRHLTSLKVLNLSGNNLTGSIPAALGNLEFLEDLDLSFNHLQGEVPSTGIFRNASALRIDGNNGLCGGSSELHMQECLIMPSNSPRNKRSLMLKVFVPISTIVSLAMVIFGILIWRGKRKRKFITLPLIATKYPKVSFNDLSRATQGFSTSNIIGRGIYSLVYRGKLVEGENEMAIKVFNLETRGSQKSFLAECNALRNMRHRNLVSILTVCSSIDSSGNDFKALVYKFMPQGDLHKLLYLAQNYESSLELNLITMAQRMSIMVDVAYAMEYLHHSNQGIIVHCDLKPSNILLDENMIAHVGDFGLARFKVGSTTSSLGTLESSSTGILGTIGYTAPEYAKGAQVSTAADVYSFGVVLLEIFLRRRPTDEIFKDGLNIVNLTEMRFPHRVLEIVDPQLIQELELCQETSTTLQEKGVSSLLSVLNIGLLCTKQSPSERINMHEVAARLHGIRDSYLRGN
ncbi:unnamed protein product [Alopecurus aequalis]